MEIKYRAPHAIDATCFRSCVCAMAWRFHAIDATLSPWSRRLDGGEAQKRAQKRAQKLAPAGSGSRELAQLLPRRSQGPLKRGLTKFSGQFS